MFKFGSLFCFGIKIYALFSIVLIFVVVHHHLLESAEQLPPPPPLSENAQGFLTTLEHSSDEELTLHLQDRMQFSKDAIACLVCVFDRLYSRIDDMCRKVQAAGNKLITFLAY